MGKGRRVAVLGLGYVGLPAAIAFAERFEGTIAFDINSARVAQLRAGEDLTREVDPEKLATTSLHLTDDPRDLVTANFLSSVCRPPLMPGDAPI